MKKLLSTLIVLVMISFSVTGLALTSYTLPEKMERQLSIGSGLKGSFVVTAEGASPLALLLQPISGIEFQMRGMSSESDYHYYVYRAGDGEQKIGLTELYGKKGNIFLRSDFIPDTVLKFPDLLTMLDNASKTKDGNPSAASALYKMLTIDKEEWDRSWKPKIDELTSIIERWLAKFAQEPSVRKDIKGNSIMDITYVVPMSEIKTCAADIIAAITSDKEMMQLVNGVFTPEQQNIYLNHNLDYYYRDVLASLNTDYDVTLVRTVTTLGKMISQTIELPLPADIIGFDTLRFDTVGSDTKITLDGDEYTVTMMVNSFIINKNKVNIHLCFKLIRKDGSKGISASVTLKKESEETTDADNKSYGSDTWELSITKDSSLLDSDESEEDFEDFEDIIATAKLNFSSKYAQSSPTTLDVDVKASLPDLVLKLTGTFKTASPWVFTPFDITNSIDAANMSLEDILQLILKWLEGAVDGLAGGTSPATPSDISQEYQHNSDSASSDSTDSGSLYKSDSSSGT